MDNHENGNGYRIFPSGASRDTGVGKLEISRYTHPAVFKRYAEYMQTKQTMPDGTHRRGDNWQGGIPEDVLLESMMRHVTDIWLHKAGWGDGTEENIQEACCAVLFNVQAILLHALEEERNAKSQQRTTQGVHKEAGTEAVRGDRVELHGGEHPD